MNNGLFTTQKAVIAFELDAVLSELCKHWQLPEGAATDGFIRSVAQELVQVLSAYCTVVSTHYEYGFESVRTQSATLQTLVRIVPPQLTVQVQDMDELPVVNHNWSVKHARNNYAFALTQMGYHPQEKEAAQKRVYLAELASTAQMLGTGLVLDLSWGTSTPEILTPLEEQTARIFALQELRQYVDVFSLPVVSDPLFLATLTAEASKPWIAHTQSDLEYEEAKDMIRMSLEAGASGAWMGWLCCSILTKLSDAAQQYDTQKLQQVVETTVRDRAVEMHRIINEVVERQTADRP